MKTKAIIIFTYALIIVAGGVVGYIMAGSLPSLIMGISFGLLLLSSAWAMLKKSTLGHFSAVTLTAILALFFAYRFALTWKLMPSGMMAIISLLVIAYFLSPKRRFA